MKKLTVENKQTICGKKEPNLKVKTRNRKVVHAWVCYIMLAPALIGFLVFTLYPILWSVRYSLYDYDGIDAYFVGFDNFIRVFRDTGFWESLGTTCILTFGKLIIELPLALFLAIAVNNKLKGSGLFRITYFLPNIISVAIVGLIFNFLFDGLNGAVNNLLLEWKLIEMPINWFGNKWTALFVVALASIWQGFGINMMFFLSGVQGIPTELYECASLDGASKWQSFRKITLPMLAPTLQVIFLLAVTGSMKTTDMVLTMTNGEPAGQTEVVMTYIFKYFFNYGQTGFKPQYGYATAMSIVVAIILGVLAALYLKATKRKTEIY